jgi:hypothetical protein
MIYNIAKTLGGKKTGANSFLVRCPCPNHGKGKGDRSPSLSVSVSMENRLLLKCFAGCTFDEIRHELDSRELLADQPFEKKEWRRPVIIPDEPNPEQSPQALALWRDSIEDCGMLIEYLARRGLLFFPRSVRWLPATSEMIVAVQRPIDGKLIAVQTTPIGKDAARYGERKATPGKLGASAVRLGKPAKVMGICEGVETGLAVQQMFGMPVWVSLGAQRLDKIQLPAECQEVHIFGDNDRAGHTAADKAAYVHHGLGRKAVMRFPADDLNDFNDVLLADADADFGFVCDGGESA